MHVSMLTMKKFNLSRFTQLCSTEKLSGLLWNKVKACFGPRVGQYILNQVFTTFRLSVYLEKDQDSAFAAVEGVGVVALKEELLAEPFIVLLSSVLC